MAYPLAEGVTEHLCYASGMATLAVQTLQDLSRYAGADAGIAPVARAIAAAGDKFPNDGNVRVQITVSNQASAPATAYVVFDSQTTCSQGHTHDIVASVAKNSTEVVGRFPPNRFNDESDEVAMTYFSDAALTTQLTTAQAAEVTLTLLRG